MDIEKLIEQANRFGMELRRDGGEFEYSIGEKFLNYATALSTLQAENEKLRGYINDLETQHRTEMCENGYDCVELGKLRAELEQVKAERDAAISDLETIMAYGGGNLDTCQYCKNGQCYARGGTKLCLPQWRGPKED